MSRTDPRPLDYPWPAPRQRFFLSGGLRLSALDWEGDRPPLVLLHGVGGNAWMWGGLAHELQALRRPIALDFRGYGDSQWSPEHRYRTEDHADDVAALAAALELDDFDIAGFSWGGLVGLAFAAAHPGRVRRLVMIDIPPSSSLPEEAIPPNFRASFADHADAVEGERALAPRAADTTLQALAALGTRPDGEGGLVRKIDPYLTRHWPFRADDRWDELRDLAVPALVVHASESPVLAAEDAAAMAQLPDVSIATVPESGHLVANEQPRRLGRAIADFLEPPTADNPAGSRQRSTRGRSSTSPESRSPSTAADGRRTAVIWHDRYSWYMPGLGAACMPAGGLVQPFEPVDSPASKTRLKTLIEVSGLAEHATMLTPEPAGEEDVLAFHDRAYLEMLKELEAAGSGEAGPAAPTGPDVYATALLSAGGCLLAVDEVMSGRHANAYALVRPPGHHARRDEAVGSCILANAVLAALHARREHGVERIAIVDWDVHHGNSMQEAFWEDPDVLTVSVHQEGYFPPGSGAVEETGGPGAPGSNLNVPLPPGTGHDAFVEVAARIVGPALADHRPDLILACTGYDGSAMDPMGRMLCHSDTYRLLARTAIAVAEEHCGGRVAMIQEGGVSPAYTPFCGVAVLEELLGVHRCEDPFLETFANVPGHAITAQQRQCIEAAAAAVPPV